MGKAPAFQFYAGDFLTGTTLMTNAEVGLYIRLLCLQAEHGAIPDDVERITAAFGPSCKAIWPVVRSKFTVGPADGLLVNDRMAEVLMARDAFRLKQSAKGKLSASSRFNHGSTTVQPLLVEPLGDGVKSIERKERATAKPPDGFDPFWAAYPIHKAKADAVKAWGRLSDAERNLCLPAITAQVKAHHFRGKDGQDFIPYGASWLNARRWEDEISSAAAKQEPMAWKEAEDEMNAIRAKSGRRIVEPHEMSERLRKYNGF